MTEHAIGPMNWDLSNYFPTPDGQSFEEYRDAFNQRLTSLLGAFQEAPALTSETIQTWAVLLNEVEDASKALSHLYSYVGCRSSENTRDEAIKGEMAKLAQTYASYSQLETLLELALGEAEQKEFDALLAEESLQGAAFSLKRKRKQALQKMSRDLEMLAAELGIDGITAWSQLYDTVSGKLEFEVEDSEGNKKQVPIALKVSLLGNSDPVTRKTALENSNAAWSQYEDVAAAALNAIAGARHTLYRRRGVEHFLDAALEDGVITRKTLNAMHEAIFQKRDVPRRYLALKSKILGLEKLGFQDVSAPLPLEGEQKVGWDEGKARILEAFGTFSEDLRAFAAHAFDQQWIEAEPRANKAAGGYCTSSRLLNESRIYMTYNDTAGDLQTLAHELGHAYHNWVMRDLRPWGRSYPMTLAETASTFAETVLLDQSLQQKNLSLNDKAALLNVKMENAAVFMLDIPMRFLFEERFYEERAKGPVSVSRCKELMLEAQKESFGDSLDHEQLDPYFWDSKLHFYIASISFYKYPYAFGFVLSLGVYARAKQEGPDFVPRFVDLLRRTGTQTSEEVAMESLGVDLESTQFWLDSIALIEQDLEEFEAVVQELFDL